jgi:hypothetical protein
MGVLPLQFKGADSWQSLGLLGDEVIDVLPDPDLTPQSDAMLVITRADGSRRDAHGPLRWGRDLALRVLDERVLDLPWFWWTRNVSTACSCPTAAAARAIDGPQARVHGSAQRRAPLHAGSLWRAGQVRYLAPGGRTSRSHPSAGTPEDS